MGLSATGLGSNLNIDSIVSGLMQVEKAPLTAIQTKQTKIQSQISAYGNVKNVLSTFQSALSGLTSLAGLQKVKATSSDSASVSITGVTGAQQSAYSIEVSQLAQAQKLVTAGQADTTTAIGSGTITIDFGTITNGTLSADGKYSGASFTPNGSDAKQITIPAGRTTLAGIRDAINAAQAGVTAAIVNDGGTTPYRLVLTDQTSGKSGSMRLSVDGDQALKDLLDHDPASTSVSGQALSETRTAQDAVFTLDGIKIVKPTNTVTDAVDGATLTLNKKTTGPVDLSLTRDDEATTAAITKFVNSYNNVNKTLRDISAYDPTTKVSAVLNGDAAIRGLQSQLRNVLSTQLDSGNALYSSLSQIGITLQAGGALAIDSSKLSTALKNDSKAVANLFATSAAPSDSQISYVSSTKNTTAGTFAVDVTRIATQGGYAGSTVSGLVVTAGVNDKLSINVDGVTASITLTSGSYTADTLAKEIQAQINQAQPIKDAGATVAVSQSGGVLSLQSKSYGSKSVIDIIGGDDPSYYFGSGTSSFGFDTAGTINGIAAQGTGQSLIGAAGDASEGLRLTISGSTGSRGTVAYSKGYASIFDDMLTKMLDTAGSISARTTGLNSTLTSLQKQTDRMNTRYTTLESQYRKQFESLDALMSKMNSTSTYLAQQLARL